MKKLVLLLACMLAPSFAIAQTPPLGQAMNGLSISATALSDTDTFAACQIPAGCNPTSGLVSVTGAQFGTYARSKVIGSPLTTGHILLGVSGAAADSAVPAALDTISSTRGALLYRGTFGWAGLPPGVNGYVLTTGGIGTDPTWSPPASGGGGGSGTVNTGTPNAPAYYPSASAAVNPLPGGAGAAGQLLTSNGPAAAPTFQGSLTVGQTSITITAAQWVSCASMIFNTAGQTITLPVATSLAPGGCLNIETQGVTVTLTPNAADGINGGGVGASIAFPADTSGTLVTTAVSGTGAFVVPLGPIQYFPSTWYKGQDLSQGNATNGVAIPIGRFATPRTVASVNCMPTVAVGGTATVDVWTAATTVIPPAAGSTQLNAASCNANTGVGANQSLGVASASVPANYWIFIIAKGAGWATSVGTGAIQVSYR